MTQTVGDHLGVPSASRDVLQVPQSPDHLAAGLHDERPRYELIDVLDPGGGQGKAASEDGLEDPLRRLPDVRWEAGETAPQPWFRPRIARALRVSLDELDELDELLADIETGRAGGPSVERPGSADGLLTVDVPAEAVDDAEHDPVVSASWSHRGTVTASVAPSSGGGLVERRTFLFLGGAALTAPAHQWLVHDPGPLVSASSGGRVPAVLVDRLPAMIAELRTLDDAAGGGAVLSLARHNVGWVSGLLDRASYDERTGRALHVALAEFGQVAGWAADDVGQRGLAQRYYLAALHAAHSADDRPLGAHILGNMAVQAARHDRPAEAVTLIETALAGARGQETPSLLASLHNRQALALATLNDASACTAAISKARTAVEQLTPGDSPPWLYWVSPAEITATAGGCLLRLGYADRAAALLEDGIALFDPSFVRDRQNYLTYLADALARPGPRRDLDAAASRGMTAIELAESLDSARGAERIRDLYDQMKPHVQVTAVGDFLERARGFLVA